MKRFLFFLLVTVLICQFSNVDAQTYYSNNFQSGLSGWTTGNHTNTCLGITSRTSTWGIYSSSGGTAISLGSSTLGTPNDGTLGAENGFITSPSFTVSSSSIIIEFDSWVSNESGYPCNYDVEYIEISIDGGAFSAIHGNVTNLHNLSSDATWRHLIFTNTVTSGSSVRLRFRLDTGDGCCGFSSTGWFIDNLVVRSNHTITTGTISPTTFCAGAAVSVPYTISGTFNAGNVFTAQLSNASGSFASPVNIGTRTATNAGTINATIPGGTTAGTGYRIRVVSSNPVVTGTDNGSNITINRVPVIACPANITVDNTVGQCGANVTFAATATGSTPALLFLIHLHRAVSSL
jgi:hypothetical protein